MSAAHSTHLDLSAPPVVKLIGRRSLVIGVVFSVIAIGLGFSDPKVFFRGYLVSFMDWRGRRAKNTTSRQQKVPAQRRDRTTGTERVRSTRRLWVR